MFVVGILISDKTFTLSKFLKSEKGKKLLNSICFKMREIGFPEISSKIELDLLIEIFSPETLNQIFFSRYNELTFK